MFSHRLFLALTLTVFLSARTMAAPPSSSWQTCSMSEGKGDGCSPSEQPRPFQEFLVSGAWSNTPGGWFSGDFHYDLEQSSHQFYVTWREIGRWGSHRIRSVSYVKAGFSFATIILAEGSPNIFSPLMKWSGETPTTKMYDHDGTKVLVLQRDYGGRVPTVSTWAWIWQVHGPVRLNVDAAIAEAIEQVAPGYGGYSPGLDWRKLHAQTGVWKGKYPGKMGVANTVDAWFELAPEGLLLRRANFRPTYEDEPRTVRWPLTAANQPAVESAPPNPSLGTVAVQLRDLRGFPLAGAEVRVQGGATAKSDSFGIASVPLPSPLPEGSPVLLEIVNSSPSLVIISPCRGVVPVSGSARAIVLAPKGDPAILSSPVALESLADCTLRTVPPLEQYGLSRYPRYRRQALNWVAQSIGTKPATLDAAIRQWGGHAQDAFARGLIALYQHQPGPAMVHLRTVIPTIAETDKRARAEFYLGRALYAQRRFAQATAHYSRSATLGHTDSELLISQALALSGLQDLTGAEQYLRRALLIEERLFGPHAPSVGVAAGLLADILLYKPDFVESESLRRRVLAIAGETAGLDSADYAQALYDMGVLAANRLDHPSAQDAFERALSIRQKSLGPYDPETADTLDQLGTSVYRRRHSCPEALPLFRKALAIRQRAFGLSHPDTALSLNSIAFCFEEAGALDQAEKHYRRAASILESTLGDDDPLLLADVLSNLACLLGNRQRLSEAIDLHRRALDLQQQVLGPDHPALIETLHGMALTLSQNGKLEQAERPLRRAAALREVASGPNHPDFAYILGNLAALLANQGKLSAAEPLLRRTLDIQVRTLATNHEDTAKSLSDLAILLDRQGELPEAIALSERALQMYRNAWGPQSQQARSAEQLLYDLRKKLNK